MGYIGITSTGKLHNCGAPRAAACNSRNAGLLNRPASKQTVISADASRFCTKCFPSGKEAKVVQDFIAA